MSVRLYVGNLPKEVIEPKALQDLFADAGNNISTKLIKDRKTRKCRGFAFVTVPTDEIADEFIEKYNNQPFMESTLKIEKALPRTKGKNGEDEEQEGTEEEMPPAEAVESKPTPAPARKKTPKTSRRPSPSNTSSDSESFQPDPRWAGELAKLKEMLATQTSNS